MKLTYIARRIKVFTAAVCLLTAAFTNNTSYFAHATEQEPEIIYSSPYVTTDNWPAAPAISARSAILINVNTGTILYDKDCDAKKYPASMTKVMTALLTIENTALSDTVTYSDNAVFDLEEGASYLALNYGEQLTVEQSLYGLMLASANDVANGLAIYTSGSIGNFVNKMNERAAQIGCTNTHFANANGLHDDNHYTSCHDMALIMIEAIKNNTFLGICSTEYYEIPPTNMQPETRRLRMLHKMMNPTDQYYYPYCICGKTGYTDEAGTTLVTYCKKDNMELISVIMDSYFTQYDDTIALMNYGFDNFTLYNMSDHSSHDAGSMIKNSLLSSILPSTSSLIQVDPKSSIILPSYESPDSVESVITYDDNNAGKSNVAANIAYYYNNIKIGESTLRFKDTEDISTYDYMNSEKQQQSVDIFAHDDKILITKSQLALYITYTILAIILLIIIIIYFSPSNRRRRQKRRTGLNLNRYD
ncbi:MAG: D-alanyl-D-alanine carboxypeptidase [Lachnospiraceae bacterium]|nr:D-alanyl-D-alanine carboxypeptidase [Lachnospiraceae bacterium]